MSRHRQEIQDQNITFEKPLFTARLLETKCAALKPRVPAPLCLAGYWHGFLHHCHSQRWKVIISLKINPLKSEACLKGTLSIKLVR